MSHMFDPTGLSNLMPGMKPSQSQVRLMKVIEYMKEFNGEDQLVMVTPFYDGPQALKRVSAEEAAKMVYDKQARLATKEEKEQFETENALAKAKLDKERARLDLTQSLRTVIRD